MLTRMLAVGALLAGILVATGSTHSGAAATDDVQPMVSSAKNWTQDALNENDEIFVKMAPERGATHPLYSGFADHFNDAYNYGVTCTTGNYPCK